MHLLVAAHDLYPDPGSGGSGRYVYETARELVDRGHRVSVITRRRGDVPHTETIDGIQVYRYDISIAGESAPGIARQLPSVLSTVSDCLHDATARRPLDVLSLQGPLTSFLVSQSVSDTVPRALTFHSPWPTEYAIKTEDRSGLSTPRWRLNVELRRVVEGRVVEAADRAIVLSEFMHDRLADVHGRDDAVVIPGGVDVDRFAPSVDASPRIESTGTSFLTVRRLSERMGHRILIDAFAAIASEYPGAELFIAGDGPLRESLQRRAEATGYGDRITFLGYVPDEELPRVYASADVFVLPTTRLEGFGLATMEALAAGTPAVGTAVGGTVDILDGLRRSRDLPADPLVPQADVDSLSTSLSRWASLDQPALDAAGTASREFARGYAWAAVVDDLEAEYIAAVADF